MSADRARSTRRPAANRSQSTAKLRYRHTRVVVPQPTDQVPVDPATTERNLYSIVLMDVIGSAVFEGQGQRRMRDDLYRLVTDVAADNGVNLDRLLYDDNGDGLRLVVPLNLLPPTRVIDAFVDGLAAGLREHRRYVSPQARLRLRVCFDLGLVEAHRGSWTGDVLVRASRLINAEPVREALRVDLDADLVAVVSDPMYELVVRPRFGRIPPDSYREIRVAVKEFAGTAWLLLPRH
jgi:hypothetical protein